MEFNYPRQSCSEKIKKILFRESKRQKITPTRISKKQRKEIDQVSKIIRKIALPKYFVREKLPGKLGHGIFLRPGAEPIQKGEVIAPYAGEVRFNPQNLPESDEDSEYVFSLFCDALLTKEEQKELDKEISFHPRRLYSCDLDALTKGNFTRFINHSETPNIEARFVKIDANEPPEILYVAKKTIHPGQQLLVCYEGEDKSYWGKKTPRPITPDTFRLDASLKVIKMP